MVTSPAGRALIESFEGCRLESYQDQRGIWTIGYGTTYYDCDESVQPGESCTQEQADEWLSEDLMTAEAVVSSLVKAPLNQNQFDALVSFAYNVGGGAFASSTLLKLINAGAFGAAAAQFTKWDLARGEVSAGLLRRRQAEQQLFVTPVTVT